MNVINNIIGISNFELVRSQIAAILANELINQNDLLENAKPWPVEKEYEYALSQSAIPSKVWEERFKRPNPEEYTIKPVINVMFAQAPLNELRTISTQNGDNTYIVEVYSGQREPQTPSPQNEGDSLASIKLQRALAQARAIIMNPNYQHLGFEDTDVE